MDIINSTDMQTYMKETFTVYASNSATGLRLEFNGLGTCVITKKGKVIYTTKIPLRAVRKYNKLSGDHA